MALQFVKMHGAGNDYVYVDGFEQSLPGDIPELARRVADRHTGIGGDGLILILPPTIADAHVRMRMFNLDGSEGQMCGNGIRCVAKYALDSGRATETPLRVETASGVLTIEVERAGDGRVSAATVDMGEPQLGPQAVGLEQRGTRRGSAFRKVADHVYGLNFNQGPGPVEMTLVSMGNPHAVVFVDSLDDVTLREDGPRIAEHEAFGDGVNVHFVEVTDAGHANVLHWERGSGPTLACGTGACAVCVAGVLTGRTSRELRTTLPGGELRLRWDEASNHVFMTGPAVEVFRGTIAV